MIVAVHLDPLRVVASNRSTGLGPRLGAAGADSEDPSRKAPISYRVAADALGSYAGRGPSPRWFNFNRASNAEAHGEALRLSLTGCGDPLPRSGQLTLRPDGSRLDLDLTLEPEVAVAEIALAFALDRNASFFGFGERFDCWDHSGRVVDGWTEDSPYHDVHDHHWTYWPLPYTVNSDGWGFVLNTSARTSFRLGTDDPGIWTAAAAERSFSATALLEPNARRTVEAFTAIYGRSPEPPAWGLGIWKTMLGGDDRVLGEIRRMETEGLPVDAVWIYDQSESGTNSGWASAMGYPEGPYEDIPSLVAKIHARGYKVLGYLNPQFLQDSPRFAEGEQRGYFLRTSDGRSYTLPCPDPGKSASGSSIGVGALLDPWNPGALSWWSEMLTTLLTDVGYDGWMHDFGEFTPADAQTVTGTAGADVRNLYPVTYQRAAIDVVAKHKPESVLFMRSGYLGSTSLCPAVWPGDQHCEWDTPRGLRGAIRAGLSLSLAGVNTFGPDIGGFFGTDDPENNEKSAELWIRWCQFGALCPVMRDHLGHKRRPDTDPVDMWHDRDTVDTWRRYGELHAALGPYLRGLAREAHQSGVASIRPLLIEFPSDDIARRIDDQYMLGPALMVAPMYQQGARSRQVYLPDGVWYSLYGGRALLGPKWHEVPAPLEHIPVFVRAGTPLPMASSTSVATEAEPGSAQDQVLDIFWHPSTADSGTSVSLPDGTVLRPGGHGSAATLGIEVGAGSSLGRAVVRLAQASQPPDFLVSIDRSGDDCPLLHTEPTRWWETPAWAADIPLRPGSATDLRVVSRL